MNAKEFDITQIEAQSKLAHDYYRKICSGLKDTQQEKDLYNLRLMRTSIRYGSMDFRARFVGTLDRAIKRLEREMAAHGN